MTVRDIEEKAAISNDAQDILKESAASLDLSPRSYHRLIKLARTIADLDGRDSILAPHILEALQYRPKELFT
jgi:magnesium chelatase family protein